MGKQFLGGRINLYYMVHRHSFLAFPLAAKCNVLKTSFPPEKLQIMSQ